MLSRHAIWALTAALLLAPVSEEVVRTQGLQHASHGSANGPCPRRSARRQSGTAT